MPAARQRASSPLSASAVMAMIHGCGPGEGALADLSRRGEAVEHRHLDVHQQTTSYAILLDTATASAPSQATSAR
jgi:hypothetical protein